MTAAGQTNIAGNVLVPRANESFWHDSDGNQLSDSLWTNTWNSENRLVEVESAVNVSGQARMREEWTHLPDGRWIQRIVSTNSGGVYYPAYTNRFVWDRQVLLAILDHTNGVVASFMRGSDLSGSIQDAGGVGGVLAVNLGRSTLNLQPSTHCVSYDGNGNVVALHNAADGVESAAYEYGPFSEPIRVTGSVASLMPLRFSTMYEDNVTGDRKYLFRDYTPSTGRWKSRDPIEEDGGRSLYGFVNNSPMNATDLLGLIIETHCDSIDEYLNSLGISFQKSGKYRYTFSGSDLGTGPGDAKMIVTRMLFAGTVFTVSSSGGSATDNLIRNVDARLTIIRNALNANFKFGTHTFRFDTEAFRKDPQAYFDSLNNGNTVIACSGLARLIFETGNKFAPQGVRKRSGPTPANLIWIPGDWGWIENMNYGSGWESGYEGENVFHTGRSGEGEMFWGHFKPGVHPAMAESEWFEFIRNWPGPGGPAGNPRWRDAVKYPTIGLDRPTTPP